MILQPLINPVKYVKMTPDQVPQYLTRHMDAWAFSDTIRAWEDGGQYCNPWQYSDSIRQQFQSDLGPLRLRLFDYDGTVWYDDNFLQKQESVNMPGLFIYESDLALNIVTVPGPYYLRIDFGASSELVLISEPLIISETSENTILLEYTNRSFYGDVIFEKGFSPSIRIPGTLKYKAPSSRDTSYEDQVLNMTMLDSKPFRLFTLYLSGPTGIPPYLIDKLNWILGCSNLTIDGRMFTKSDGAKLEENTVDDFAKSGWSIEMREKLNRSSIIYGESAIAEGEISVVLSTDSKGFIESDGGGSSISQFLDVV